MNQLIESIPSELIDNGVIEADPETYYGDLGGMMYNIGERYRVNKLRILVNSKNYKSSFNYGQVQLIKKYGGMFDNRNEVWFIGLLNAKV